MDIDYSDNYIPEYTPGINPKISISVTIAITVWVVISNTTLIFSILLSPGLRRRKSSWLLLNMCIADLLVGVVITPFATYYESQNEWQFGRRACFAWLLADVLLGCLSLFALFVINLDRLIFVTQPACYERKMSKTVLVILIISTWFSALAIVVPVFFSGQYSGFNTMDKSAFAHMCHIELTRKYAIGSSIAIYYVPGTVIIIINILLILILCIQIRKRQTISLTPHDEFISKYILQPAHAERVSQEGLRQMKQCVKIMTVVNFFYLSMWFPFFLFNTLMGMGEYNLVSPAVISGSIWLAYSNSGINPFLWMMYPHVRRSVVSLLSCQISQVKQQAPTLPSYDSNEQPLYYTIDGD